MYLIAGFIKHYRFANALLLARRPKMRPALQELRGCFKHRPLHTPHEAMSIIIRVSEVGAEARLSFFVQRADETDCAFVTWREAFFQVYCCDPPRKVAIRPHRIAHRLVR